MFVVWGERTCICGVSKTCLMLWSFIVVNYNRGIKLLGTNVHNKYSG